MTPTNLEQRLQTQPQHRYESLSTDSPDSETLSLRQKEVGDGISFEYLAYNELIGTADFVTAEYIFFLNQAHLLLKQVRIVMEDSAIVVEPGLVHTMKGGLALESMMRPVSGQARSQGLKSLGMGLLRALTARETLFLTRISGTGVIYLEPTWKHMYLLQMHDEELIVDRGSFVCGQDTLQVEALLQRTVSAALFGQEGLFQTRVAGSGIALFVIPVPFRELRRFDLVDDKLCLDGGYAVARTGGLTFRAELSASRSLFQTLTSGELLFQTFSGTGSVWVAPTMNVYRDIGRYRNIGKNRRFGIRQ